MIWTRSSIICQRCTLRKLFKVLIVQSLHYQKGVKLLNTECYTYLMWKNILSNAYTFIISMNLWKYIVIKMMAILLLFYEFFSQKAISSNLITNWRKDSVKRAPNHRILQSFGLITIILWVVGKSLFEVEENIILSSSFEGVRLYYCKSLKY